MSTVCVTTINVVVYVGEVVQCGPSPALKERDGFQAYKHFLSALRTK